MSYSIALLTCCMVAVAAAATEDPGFFIAKDRFDSCKNTEGIEIRKEDPIKSVCNGADGDICLCLHPGHPALQQQQQQEDSFVKNCGNCNNDKDVWKAKTVAAVEKEEELCAMPPCFSVSDEQLPRVVEECLDPPCIEPRIDNAECVNPPCIAIEP